MSASKPESTTGSMPANRLSMVAECAMPTKACDEFRMRSYVYSSSSTGTPGGACSLQHFGSSGAVTVLAVFLGELRGCEDVLVHVHNQCLSSEVFGSLRCDCREQLDASLALISKRPGGGVIIYLQQEGRGMGLANKAGMHFGRKNEKHEYDAVPDILADLGVKSIRLITNNPFELDQLAKLGVKITERVEVVVNAAEPGGEKKDVESSVGEEEKEGGGKVGGKVGKPPASLGSLPEDTRIGVLQHLDAQSLNNTSACNKLFRREGKLVAKHIVEYLQKKHFCSPFVLVAALGDDEPGQVGYLEMMWKMTRDVDEVLILGGYTTEVNKATIEQDGALIRFEIVKPTLTSRFDQTVVYLHGEVLICSPCATEHWDTLLQTQTQRPTSLPDDLCWTTTCVFTDKLLAIGGYIQGIRSDIMYELEDGDGVVSKERSKWRAHAARLNTGRYSTAAVEFEGKLFVCGGYGANGSTLRSVESLSSLSPLSEWQVEHDMRKSRRDATLVVFESELYAVGGDHGGNTTIEKRSKITNLWEQVADSNEFRYACAAALVGSKIFLFGGGYGQSEKTFDFYDLHSKKWASKDQEGAFFEVAKRLLPNKVFRRAAVHLNPPDAKSKKWNDLLQEEA